MRTRRAPPLANRRRPLYRTQPEIKGTAPRPVGAVGPHVLSVSSGCHPAPLPVASSPPRGWCSPPVQSVTPAVAPAFSCFCRRNRTRSYIYTGATPELHSHPGCTPAASTIHASAPDRLGSRPCWRRPAGCRTVAGRWITGRLVMHWMVSSPNRWRCESNCGARAGLSARARSTARARARLAACACVRARTTRTRRGGRTRTGNLELPRTVAGVAGQLLPTPSTALSRVPGGHCMPSFLLISLALCTASFHTVRSTAGVTHPATLLLSFLNGSPRS